MEVARDAGAVSMEQCVNVRWDLEGGGIRCARASDLLVPCRTALLAHDGYVQPDCVMGDMLMRTPPTHLARMDKLVADAAITVKAHLGIYSEFRNHREGSFRDL